MQQILSLSHNATVVLLRPAGAEAFSSQRLEKEDNSTTTTTTTTSTTSTTTTTTTSSSTTSEEPWRQREREREREDEVKLKCKQTRNLSRQTHAQTDAHSLKNSNKLMGFIS